MGSADWARSTPCEEWTVRDVVNHVVGQNIRHVLLLEGGSLEEYSKIRDDDFLGKDPLASWVRGNRRYDIAYAQPRALEKIVEFHWGPTTGRELLFWRIFELTVHTWDLARGIGADDRLDEGLVAAMLGGYQRRLNSSGTRDMTIPSGGSSSEGSAQETLLLSCGRTVG